jgi:hypothetical protein
MKSKDEIRRAVLMELAHLGIRGEVQNGGKHARVIWEHNGQVRTLIIPGTPGDRRAKLNCMCDLRRALRKDGVLAR